MAKSRQFTALTAAEAAMFADPHWAALYPLVLSVDQAAALAQVPKQTVYGWSSQGLLAACKARAGKHVRLHRDRFVQSLFEGHFHGND